MYNQRKTRYWRLLDHSSSVSSSSWSDYGGFSALRWSCFRFIFACLFVLHELVYMQQPQSRPFLMIIFPTINIHHKIPVNPESTAHGLLLLSGSQAHISGFMWRIKETVNNSACARITHGMYKAVAAVLLSIQNSIFNENWDGSQDKRHKEIHVDEVPGAVELPVGEKNHKLVMWGEFSTKYNHHLHYRFSVTSFDLYCREWQ